LSTKFISLKARTKSQDDREQVRESPSNKNNHIENQYIKKNLNSDIAYKNDLC
jgi:hypothetical protein